MSQRAVCRIDWRPGGAMPDANDAELKRIGQALARLTVGPQASLLLAVSGGPDSMAMLDLVVQGWQGPVLAATVDHGLRNESADEAHMVADFCAERGIAHATLRPHEPISGSLQAAARSVRYALLHAHADCLGADHVVTAHHADDQLETIMMRLARGAGVDGLSAVRARNGRVIRPMLGFRKAELVQYCAAQAIPFATDPSNASNDFDRVRMRQALAGFDAVDPLMAARSASALAEAAEALDWAAAREAARALVPERDGVRLTVTDYPPGLLRRLVVAALQQIEPDIAVRGPALDRLLAQLLAGEQAMIGNVLCRPGGAGQGWVFRPAPPRGGSFSGIAPE